MRRHGWKPEVTCVCSTMSAPVVFLETLLADFATQEFPDVELILMGAACPVNIAPFVDGMFVRFIQTDKDTSLGYKRNLGFSHARSNFVCVWEAGDRHYPMRVSRQVYSLLKNNAAITGTSKVACFDYETLKHLDYTFQGIRRPWVYDRTVCMRKDYWSKFPYQTVELVPENNKFVSAAGDELVHDSCDSSFMLAGANGDYAVCPGPRLLDEWSTPVQLTDVFKRSPHRYAATR